MLLIYMGFNSFIFVLKEKHLTRARKRIASDKTLLQGTTHLTVTKKDNRECLHDLIAFTKLG